jgi:hypothetical protein
VQQLVAVAVDVSGLTAAPSPLTGTVTFTAPGALNSLVVPVTLNLPGVTATWTVPAPASVASGQVFPLALTVMGNFLKVSGEVFACPTTVPVDQCVNSINQETPAFSSQIQVAPSSFAGPPGTYTFTAQGIDCAQSDDIYFVARLFLVLPGGGTFLGPFFGPQTTTTLQAATGPLLQALPPALTVNAFAGLNPPPQTLTLLSACGQALDFTGASDVPWLSVSPAGGTIPVFGAQAVTAAVDVTQLTASPSPLAATLTFTAPGALDNPLLVPLTLNLVGP